MWDVPELTREFSRPRSYVNDARETEGERATIDRLFILVYLDYAAVNPRMFAPHGARRVYIEGESKFRLRLFKASWVSL